MFSGVVFRSVDVLLYVCLLLSEFLCMMILWKDGVSCLLYLEWMLFVNGERKGRVASGSFPMDLQLKLPFPDDPSFFLYHKYIIVQYFYGFPHLTRSQSPSTTHSISRKHNPIILIREDKKS